MPYSIIDCSLVENLALHWFSAKTATVSLSEQTLVPTFQQGTGPTEDPNIFMNNRFKIQMFRVKIWTSFAPSNAGICNLLMLQKPQIISIQLRHLLYLPVSRIILVIRSTQSVQLSDWKRVSVINIFKAMTKSISKSAEMFRPPKGGGGVLSMTFVD